VNRKVVNDVMEVKSDAVLIITYSNASQISLFSDNNISRKLEDVNLPEKNEVKLTLGRNLMTKQVKLVM
jgi:hypothetical protein